MDERELDEIVQRYEEGDTWHDDDEVVEVSPPPRKRPVDKVLPIRLSGDEWEKLREIAGARKLGPSTLLRAMAQQWIREASEEVHEVMKTAQGSQYDRVRLKDGRWVDFTEERRMPDDAPVAARWGDGAIKVSSNLLHILRAFVYDRENREQFTVEYRVSGPGDPKDRDAPLRREVDRRLRADDWKLEEAYEVTPVR